MSDDPFAPENVPVIQSIMLFRIYDVGMAILTSMDEEAASRLVEFHARGGIMSPPPAFDPEASYESEGTPSSEQD